MRKKFNIIGWCHPKRHYMADISAKVKQVLQMIIDGDYFIKGFSCKNIVKKLNI